jgi:O-antigen ligase
VAIALAVSPLRFGFYELEDWAPMALGTLMLLVVLVRAPRPPMSRLAVAASCGLLGLLCMSAASILWAESKELTWTVTNRLVLYVAIFLVVLVAVRERRDARLVLLVLGASALGVCLWLDVRFVIGGARGAFLYRRLNDPIGYINGTAVLLAMGAWPWLACAETATRRWRRSASLSAATLILATCLLSQSRAAVAAALGSALLVVACAPGRVRRAINLLIVVAGVAATLPWSLAVYSSGGPSARNLLPGQTLLTACGIALAAGAIAAGVVHCVASPALERVPASARPGRRSAGALLAASVIVLVVLGLLAAPFVGRQWREFTALRVESVNSSRFVDAGGYRYDLWRVALEEFRARPIAGFGAGNYDARYYELRRNPEYVLQPHSIELQMLAELGVLGFTALAVFCGAALVGGFRRTNSLASSDLMIKLAALGMFSAWLIETSVDWAYDIAGVTGMAMCAAALLVAPRSSRVEARPAGRFWIRAMLLLIGFAAASVGRQYVADRVAASGAAKIDGSPAAAIAELRTAAQLDPYSLQALYSLAAAYARLDNYPAARATLVAGAAREPLNYVPPALLGDLAMRRGDYPLAVAEYDEAIALDPRDPSLRSALKSARSALRATGARR